MNQRRLPRGSRLFLHGSLPPSCMACRHRAVTAAFYSRAICHTGDGEHAHGYFGLAAQGDCNGLPGPVWRCMVRAVHPGQPGGLPRGYRHGRPACVPGRVPRGRHPGAIAAAVRRCNAADGQQHGLGRPAQPLGQRPVPDGPRLCGGTGRRRSQDGGGTRRGLCRCRRCGGQWHAAGRYGPGRRCLSQRGQRRLQPRLGQRQRQPQRQPRHLVRPERCHQRHPAEQQEHPGHHHGRWPALRGLCQRRHAQQDRNRAAHDRHARSQRAAGPGGQQPARPGLPRSRWHAGRRHALRGRQQRWHRHGAQVHAGSGHLGGPGLGAAGRRPWPGSRASGPGRGHAAGHRLRRAVVSPVRCLGPHRHAGWHAAAAGVGHRRRAVRPGLGTRSVPAGYRARSPCERECQRLGQQRAGAVGQRERRVLLPGRTVQRRLHHRVAQPGGVRHQPDRGRPGGRQPPGARARGEQPGRRGGRRFRARHHQPAPDDLSARADRLFGRGRRCQRCPRGHGPVLHRQRSGRHGQRHVQQSRRGRLQTAWWRRTAVATPCSGSRPRAWAMPTSPSR